MSSPTFTLTGDESLDSLLGFVTSPYKSFADDFTTILITGAPGAGKSTLCSQMAGKFVHNTSNENPISIEDPSKRGVIYYSTEERLKTIFDRTSNIFGKQKLLPVYAFDGDKDTIKGKLSGKTPPGVILRFDVPVAEYNNRLISMQKSIHNNEKPSKHLYQNISRIKEDIVTSRVSKFSTTVMDHVKLFRYLYGWNEILVIVDNISTLFESSIGKIPRSLIRALFDAKYRLGKEFKPIFTFVSESSDRTHKEEYLSDIHVHLSVDKNSTFGQRFVTIQKARNRSVEPICHRITLDGKGIKIIPKRVLWEAKKSKSTAFVSFDSLNHLNKHLVLPGLSDRKKYGLRTGSATLFYGGHETRKTILSLYFLKDGAKKGEPNLKLLTFVDNDQASAILADRVLQSTRKDFSEENVVNHADSLYSLSAFENIVYSETIYSETPSRLVIIDLCQLFLRFPEEDVMETLNYVIRNISRAGATTIFTYTTINEIDYRRAQTLRFLFDNVFKMIVCSNFVGVPQEIAVKIEKYDNTNVFAPLIHCSLDPNTINLTTSDEVLRTAYESRDGQLRQGNLRIHYYTGESNKLKKHCDFISRIIDHNSSFEDNIDTWEIKEIESNSVPAGAARLSGFLQPINSIQESTEIITVDEQWLHTLSHQLVPLGKLSDNKDGFQNDDYCAQLGDAAENKYNFFPKYIHEPCAYPYYANMTTFVHNKKYISDFISANEDDKDVCNFFHRNGTAKEEFKSAKWADIFEIGTKISKWLKANGKVTEEFETFHYSHTSEECCSCLILALLWDKFESYLCSKERTDFDNSDTSIFFDNKSSIMEWFGEATECGFLSEKKINNGKVSEESGAGNTKTLDFLFGHMWFVTYLNLEDHRQTDKYELHPIPSINGTISQGISISGHWFLGVRNGSKNTELAKKVIEQILNKYTLDLMFHTNTAIPAKRRYWERDFNNREKAMCLLKQAKSRLSIHNYTDFSRTLSDLYTDLVKLFKDPNREWVDSKVSEMLKGTDIEIKYARSLGNDLKKKMTLMITSDG